MTGNFLTQHIAAIRRRVYTVVGFLAVTFAISFVFADILIAWFRRPLPTDLVFYGPAEALFAAIKVAFFAAILVTMPVLMYQIWKFFEPAFLPHERHSVFPYIAIATLLFMVGLAVCNMLILPLALEYLVAQGEKLDLVPALAVGQYIDFNAKFLLVFGVAFELPLVMTMLSRIGAISAALLVQFRKHAILVFFLLATIMTPTPDAFNLLLMAVPLILLYEVGIVSVRLWGRPGGAPPKKASIMRQRPTTRHTHT